MSDTEESLPTKEKCWADFWEIIGPALYDAWREGRLDDSTPPPEAPAT